MKKIIIVAGDKSGDIYGALLSEKLKNKFSSLKIYSLGGNALRQYSHQLINLTSYSVSGIYEALIKLNKFINIFQKALWYIDDIKPDLIILIDFPDFNLRLAKKLNKNYPIFYYVSPQVWAWREKRIEIIRKYIDKMVVIFKFEQDFYIKKGIKTLYFGHPLLEIISPASEYKRKNIISFLPGSRKNEIKHHLPILNKTYKILKEKLNDYLFRIIKSENIEDNYYKKYARGLSLIPHSYKALGESKFIIASSGTATIEMAILEIPHLIIYKINPLSWYLLKKMVKTKYIGMVNILSSHRIVEELLQKDINPQKIAEVTLEYINNKDKYTLIQRKLREVKEILTPYGATDKFSNYIGKYLNII